MSMNRALTRLLRNGTAFSAIALATGVGFAHAQQTPPAQPQPAPQATGSDTGDIVVITGSLIPRAAETAPAPLIQIQQEELLNSGEPNIIDFLADIPALSGSQVPEDTVGVLNATGLSLLNLRDLGAVRTLVLVDGRRHVGAPQGSLAVDVDTIPSLLIESAEIVTGGQSAIYGADAVSGVVNFIMKKNFDGLEVDGSLAEINQDGQRNQRISMLAGKNLFDERLNVYAFAEFQEGDEVRDSDVDWRRKAYTLLNTDTDATAAPDDGDIDNVLLVNARDPLFNRGGTVLLAAGLQASPLNDPDVPFVTCPTGAATFNTNISGGAANCFNVSPDVGKFYLFPSAGEFRLVNFGVIRDGNGQNRRINVGGDGLNAGTEFGQGSRIPESINQRYQAGFNFDVLPNVNVYGEYKYVRDKSFIETQPTFFQGGIGTPVANQTAGIFSTANFNVGIDNAYLPAGLRTLIQSNTRQIFGAPTATTAGAVTGTVADTRATFNMFGPNRTQTNVRTVDRFVLGARGSLDQVAFFKDVAWDVGYTFGQSENNNYEQAVDVVRFALSSDAVVDTTGVLGTPGAIVCRATLLSRQGVSIPDDAARITQGITRNLSPNDPIITQCRPTNIFGVDLRDNSTAAASRAYWTAGINVSHTNIQQDFMATVGGNLWDFWGAGPIGVAVGYEARKEKTGGIGRSRETAGRLLFLNTGPDFTTAGYSTDEYFGEVRLPLIKDTFLGEYAEVSAAYRKSDYTTVGEQEAKNFTAQYRPVSDLLFRVSYGESIRIPNLAENFAPATQTFANGFVDPCDFNNLRNFTQTNAVLGANRRANCIALLGSQYNPDTTVITYPSGVPGFNSGNPFLQPETSRSYTGSFVYTPSWLERTSLVLDYYDIKITNVIAAVSAQQAANQCVTEVGLNPGACATITRNGFIAANDPNNFRMISFIQGSLNYAATLAKGIDFTATTGFDLKPFLGFEAGEVNLRLRGNYLIRQQDFTNIAIPSAATDNDSLVGFPRVRYLLTTSWQPNEKLRLAWDIDWQASQELLDKKVFLTNGDTRPRQFANTDPFVQHDFTVSYDVFEDFRLRAGIVNAFDRDPDPWLGSNTSADNFDLFGRRFFVGFNYKY